MKRIWILLLVLALVATPAMAKKKAAQETEKENDKPMSAKTFAGLELRSIGPTINSGRVSDFAVHPRAHHIIYAAIASGNLWKTTNAGTTWEPIFDKEGSFAIGCVTLDPSNPHVVWVGTGENNSQRSVAFGDGVYKSLDGGQNWENVGLNESEHIGMITIDPRDSNVVYVASQGPLWRSGGERGVYKTTDGGKTWEKIFYINEETGAIDLVMHPSDPETLYASSWQRVRKKWNDPRNEPQYKGSGIHKTTDGGKTWKPINNGLQSPNSAGGSVSTSACLSPMCSTLS